MVEHLLAGTEDEFIPIAVDRKQYLREWRIKRVYNLSPEQFEEMWEIQQGCCKLCKVQMLRDVNGRNRMSKEVATIDHCHNTGFVRGILCNRCNSGLGHFASIEVLQSAIRYLVEFVEDH